MINFSFRTKLILTTTIPLLTCTILALFVSSNKLEEQGIETLERQSYAILNRMEAIRSYVATQTVLKDEVTQLQQRYPNGKIPDFERERLLKKVPIFASMAVGEDSRNDNYTFRVASSQARNPENKADKMEEKLIRTFKDNSELADSSFINEATNELWVVRPVKLSEQQSCLLCHGAPSKSPWGNSKDILGYEMENFKDGDIAGLFILKSSLSANDNEVQATIQEAVRGIVILMAIVLIIVLLFMVGFIRETSKKILEVINANKRISEGDLTTKIEIRGKDEFSNIAIHINGVVDSIRSVVSSVNEACETLNIESENSMNESQALSSLTNNHAVAVEEISASMEEMAATIEQNKENASLAEENVSESVKEIIKGNESSHKAISSMSEIESEIKTIEDIAQQTNILAINAAIEAAKAGEVGAGFAVVAAEVKKLSEKSRYSADAISQLFIKGVSTVTQTGSKLTDIIPEIKKTSTIISEVNASSAEQSIGANEINLAIQNISNAMQENADIADRMNAKAKALLERAKVLQSRIDFFKL